ncbi:dermonecrotic toxin LruSicTox-alphaIC2 [Trichonephila clavata]|uniref:Dermonecrotic toxin LruSicTox-alphaIC2 n=1 Tax=Trichonephila clavata TaxID=2740835 RepID=A0A8X6HCG4_TRICU|nr:dermonecrotic toxin LruSicTox-alphaIC2 [Trichonephila clavata]
MGHLVNSIEEISEFLERGSNVLESDIEFFKNGSVKTLHHGFPCDCGRECENSANMADYLQAVRNITDPNVPGNYYDQLVLQFFDLKLHTSEDKRYSGREIARHVLDYLWGEAGEREQEIRVIIYFEKLEEKDVVLGVVDEFTQRGQTARLKDVGFDGGTGNISDIARIFSKLDIKDNIWIGDGATNCFEPFKSFVRLKKVIDNRDSSKSFISKVYQWTNDLQTTMGQALRLGVDGMITNKPEVLLKVLNQPEFANDFRLATIYDNPFERYEYE